MADDALQMRARVIDEFSAPLKKLRSELGSIKPPADMGRLRDQMGGLSQAATRAGDAVRTGIGAAMTGLGLGAISATGAIAGAVAALKGFGQQTAELRHFSAEVGLSVQRLRELQAVGQRFGIDDSAMLGGLKKFSGELFDLRRRTGQAYEELLKSGPGGAQLVEQLMGAKTPEEAIGKVLGFLERLPNAMQRQRLGELLFGSGLFGRLGEGGPGSLSKLFEEIGKTIGKTTDQGVEAARRFEQEFGRLRETLEGIRNEAGEKLLPTINEGLANLRKALTEIDWKSFGDGAGAVLKDIIQAAKELAGLFREIGQLLKGDMSPIFGENAYKGAGSRILPTPGVGTPGRAALEGWLEQRRAELEKRRDEYRKSGDKASEIAAQSKLDRIVEELRKLRESAERGATVQQQSFGGTGGGFAGLIHNASLGGMGGGSGMSGVAPRRPGPIGDAPNNLGPIGSFKGGTFGSKAPGVMRQLMADFNLTREQAAGIVGNLGHESAGFRQMQEQKPMIPGSRGGWGWAQWTGPRRRAFEAWVKEKGLDPKSDEANYGFLRHELQTTQKGALTAVRRQSSAMGAMQAFELEFERSGVKAWGSRQKWTQRALEAYNADKERGPSPTARLGDDMMRRNFASPKVEGDARVRIELNGFPKGTRVEPEATGMFKTIELDRGRQMAGVDV